MKKIFFLVSLLLFVAACSNPDKSTSVANGIANTEGAIYQDYTVQRYEELRGNKPFAIFFYAKWCGECREVEEDLLANLNMYPEEIIILKADYDSETELREEFGVKVQTTFVLFDEEGKVVLIEPMFEAKEVIEAMLQNI